MRLVILALAAACLSGCAGLSSLTGSSEVPSILGNLQDCDRRYSGSLGLGVAGSFDIVCKAQVAVPTPISPGGVP